MTKQNEKIAETEAECTHQPEVTLNNAEENLIYDSQI